MSTVQELLAQKATLDAQIKQAKVEAFAGVVATIVGLCAEHGLSLNEMAVELRKRDGKKLPRKSKAPPRFRYEPTGATWTGVGRKPKWFDDFENVKSL